MRYLIFSGYGILNGKFFCKEYPGWGIPQEDKDILLKGPNHPLYKETWYRILNTSSLNKDDKVYRLEEDLDLNLFLVEK